MKAATTVWRTYQKTSKVMQVFSEHLLRCRVELGASEKFLQMVTRAAPMHDLGKIAVVDAVLRKQGGFTDEEFEMMKNHPLQGVRIVRQILDRVDDEEFVRIAENVAHYHHEKWD